MRHVTAGPFEGLAKEDLPAQLCAFTSGLMRLEAARPPGWYDLVHSHYWLSGQVAWLAAERWDVPLVHSMHTMAKVKNLTLADGDAPEPLARAIGEAQVVAAADRLVASTAEEADQLVELYDADPDQVADGAPGRRPRAVHPRLPRRAPGPGWASATTRYLLLFVGRIQPLKAPDVLLRAAARLLEHRPALRDRLVVAVVGGPSGVGPEPARALRRWRPSSASPTSCASSSRRPQDALPDWYRAADLTVVPSYSESFGLVAIESQACGTPVVAAVGRRPAHRGRRRPVRPPGRPATTPTTTPRCSRRWPTTRTGRAVLGRGAVEHAARFGWARDRGRHAGRLRRRRCRARAPAAHRGQPVTVRRP